MNPWILPALLIALLPIARNTADEPVGRAPESYAGELEMLRDQSERWRKRSAAEEDPALKALFEQVSQGFASLKQLREQHRDHPDLHEKEQLRQQAAREWEKLRELRQRAMSAGRTQPAAPAPGRDGEVRRPHTTPAVYETNSGFRVRLRMED